MFEKFLSKVEMAYTGIKYVIDRVMQVLMTMELEMASSAVKDMIFFFMENGIGIDGKYSSQDGFMLIQVSLSSTRTSKS
jgi:hypothetical protein